MKPTFLEIEHGKADGTTRPLPPPGGGEFYDCFGLLHGASPGRKSESV